jgi:chloramphenicol O-acetyltransferase
MRSAFFSRQTEIRTDQIKNCLKLCYFMALAPAICYTVDRLQELLIRWQKGEVKIWEEMSR